MSRRPNSHSPLKVILILLMIVMIVATGVLIKLSLDLTSQPPESRPPVEIDLPTAPAQTPADTTQPTAPSTTDPTTVPTEPDPVVSTATISVQGDLLMHKYLFDQNSACYKGAGSYDFSSIFRYLTDTLSGYDYSIANLETTFGGDEFPYRGNPLFNCPDPFADSIQAAGYEMLLTANNHCYDTRMTGIKRTLEQVRSRNIATLGTRMSTDESRYSIVDINGIRVGMVCYTFTTSMLEGKPRLNGDVPVEEPELVNYFSNQKLNVFYSEMEEIVAGMNADGAEAKVIYIHWGEEYELKENGTQQQIAQKLCDMGMDVIVGGHPHVLQPMSLLTSGTDPEHKTVCIYSLGNSVSNQRIHEMRLKTGHTEDGCVFTMTFEKYEDGSVYLADVDVLPTWVNMHSKNGGKEYNILPLDPAKQDQWQEMFNLTDAELEACKSSWERTDKMVGEGLTASREYLAQQKAARDALYLSK